MIDKDAEIYSEREWIAKQISINESQLSDLQGLKGKENFKAIYAFSSMILAVIGLVFFSIVLIHPNGVLLVSHDIFQFSGITCVFLGYALFVSSNNYYEHRSIVNQIREYIYQQRKALDFAKEALFSRDEVNKNV